MVFNVISINTHKVCQVLCCDFVVAQLVRQWPFTMGAKFHPRPVHVGFVVDRDAYWVRFLFKYFSFPLSLSLHQCSILMCHVSNIGAL